MESSIGLPLPIRAVKLQQRRHRWRRHIHRCLLACEILVSLVVVGWFGLHFAILRETIPQKWFEQNTLSLLLLDRDGKYLHEKPAENGQFGNWLPGGKIPRKLRIMAIAAEDHRIYRHAGVDLFAVIRAAWGNVFAQKRRSGASTISMQLVRLLTPQPRTYANKIKEIYWALVLQHQLGVDGVLREYLNRAPYGNRVQGVHRAALLYFDRPAADLSLAQAAFLTSLPWGPSYLNPFDTNGRKRAWRRARWILHRALKLGLIAEQSYREAIADPIQIQTRPTRPNTAIHFTQRISQNWLPDAKADASERVTTVHTTLDLWLQRRAEDLLRRQLQKLRARGAGTGAVMILDHRSGEILAYVASHNYFDQTQRGSIDYIQIPQSPGSTLKPFIFAQAIDRLGYTGATLLADIATAYLWRRGTYNPRNDDNRFLGPLRLRVALGNSRNIPALRLLSQIGLASALQFLRNLGFDSLDRDADYYGLGLAIGSAETRMIELMRAYAIMARGGSALNLRWADAASDSLGRMRDTGSLLPQLFAPAMPSSIIPISKSALQITSQFLSDPAARLPSFGRYSSLEYPFPVAVKTGSSQGHRNAWTIAFSDRVVIGCWIGSHNRRSMSNLYGAEACGPVVHHAMLAAMQRVDPRQTPRDLPTPSNWVKKTICPLSGQVAGPHCPGSVEEWFPAQHTHKQTTCTFHQNIDLDRRNSLRASSKCPSQHRVARPFVVVPPQFTLWAAMLNLPQPPAQISPLCPEPNTQHTPLLYIRIRQPLDNARYIIDPTIPSQYATIALQAETSIPVHEILWLHNDKPLAHTTNTHYLRWLLSPGTHRFIATDKSGTQRSRSVTIHVQ